MVTQTQASQPDQVGSKGLKGGALGLLSSVVVGMASTAPAYSLAASLGFIVASGGALLAGVKAPGIVLLAFIPMYLTAVAYQELNKAEPDCGTTFTWTTRAFGPIAGWIGGWGIIAADVIVMANLAQIAGSYTFIFMGEIGLTGFASLADSQFWSTTAGVIWIIVMTYICYRGIELSARIQYWLLAIEVIVLVLFSAFALVRVYSGTAESYSLIPSLDWFNPFTLDFGTVIAPAVLTAVFIYWGWDTAVSVNEETADPGKTPGRAAIISTLLLLATYALVTVAALAFAGVGTEGIGLGNPANAADVFAAIGPALFGNTVLGNLASVLLAVSILSSSAASTQTTILPTARTALSMAVYKALPDKFAKIHQRFLTPTWSTLAMGAISIGFYVLFTLISVQLLGALIGSVGLMIALYYGLTGYACAWYYRRTMWSSFRHVIMRGLFPLLGGLMLTGAFVYGLQQYAQADWLTDDNGNNVTIFGIGAVAVVGVGAMLIGVVVMVIWWTIRPAFFRGGTLPRQTDDIVLARTESAAIPVFGLPDSRVPPVLIEPDLSNLPPGQEAVNAETGEEIETPSQTPPPDPDRHPRPRADDDRD